MSEQTPTTVSNWYDAFPMPVSTPEKISVEQLHSQLIQHLKEESGGSSTEKADFLVVDVRRTDFEDSFIKGAINLPAHSFYQTLPSLIPILTRYKQVIFHCQSSSGRGPRCAAWYQDRLDSLGIEKRISQGVVLEGGIKRWRATYGDDKDLNVIL